MWEPRRLTNLWASTACYMDNFTSEVYRRQTEIPMRTKDQGPSLLCPYMPTVSVVTTAPRVRVPIEQQGALHTNTTFVNFVKSLPHYRSLALIHFHFLSKNKNQNSKTTVHQLCDILQRQFVRFNKSRGSSVGIATGYGVDDREVGSSSPGRVKNFLLSKSLRPDLGSTQPPNQWAPGALSPGVKRQGREAGHSPPTSAEVKKTWIYTSTPHTSSWRSA
jgi:hypothetical protein